MEFHFRTKISAQVSIDDDIHIVQSVAVVAISRFIVTRKWKLYTYVCGQIDDPPLQSGRTL